MVAINVHFVTKVIPVYKNFEGSGYHLQPFRVIALRVITDTEEHEINLFSMNPNIEIDAVVNHVNDEESDATAETTEAA